MYRLIGSLRTRAFRVAWMLEELGLAWTHEDVMPHSDTVRAADGGGKVPVLVTDEGPMWDSVAILTFLADRHGAFAHPAGSYARARQDAATLQILDEIEGLLWTAARHSFILPEPQRVPEIKESLRWEFARNLGRIAARLGEGEYLADDAPTIPDLLLAHCTGWAAVAKFELTEPAVLAHFERMRTRPAYGRADALRG